MKPDILNYHVQAIQQIVDFIQSMGWSVDGLSIYRYDDNNRGGIWNDEDDKTWKAKPPVYKWGLELKVAPKDEDDDDKKARERQPHA